MTVPPLRDGFPLAWQFHQNTARFAHNADAGAGDSMPLSSRENGLLPTVKLAKPRTLDKPLGTLLERRASCRSFAAKPLTLKDLATLMRHGYGVQGHDTYDRLSFPRRSVPSGGGLYPLEVSLICRQVTGLAPGVYHYHPPSHCLETMSAADLPKVYLDYLFMGQTDLTAAPLLIVLSGALYRNCKKYGDRGYRYALYEAGHLMQNINLCASAIGLGSCNIGGFFDMELAGVLGIDYAHEVPLYAAAIGKPKTANRLSARNI
jgi:SagB-type dehydrogenase family enzyme